MAASLIFIKGAIDLLKEETNLILKLVWYTWKVMLFFFSQDRKLADGFPDGKKQPSVINSKFVNAAVHVTGWWCYIHNLTSYLTLQTRIRQWQNWCYCGKNWKKNEKRRKVWINCKVKVGLKNKEDPATRLSTHHVSSNTKNTQHSLRSSFRTNEQSQNLYSYNILLTNKAKVTFRILLSVTL